MNVNQALFCVVELELAGSLVARDGDTALMEHPFSGIHLKRQEASKERSMYQERTHSCLERMTLFFKRPNPGCFWTKPQVIFYSKPTALISRPVGCLPRFL